MGALCTRQPCEAAFLRRSTSPALGKRALTQCFSRVLSLEVSIGGKEDKKTRIEDNLLEQEEAAALLLARKVLVDDLVTNGLVGKAPTALVQE